MVEFLNTAFFVLASAATIAFIALVVQLEAASRHRRAVVRGYVERTSHPPVLGDRPEFFCPECDVPWPCPAYEEMKRNSAT